MKKSANRRGMPAVTAAITLIIATLSVSSTARAQCTQLISHVCRGETSIPHDYSFLQNNNYWTVVGVIPTSPDDKDITVYSACGSGSVLGSSYGTDGIDFVVGDFNHNTLGTYYPRVTYGDLSAFHNVYWNNGGWIFPVGTPIFGTLGGSGSGCNMIRIFDLYLEAAWQYRFSFHPGLGTSARAALFRNPSTGAYWAGRSARQFEIATGQQSYYTTPQSDWYGLLVFPNWNLPASEDFGVYVERLYDCIPLTSDECVNKKLYSVSSGPANDYKFTQTEGYWSVVAVLPDTLDQKALGIYSDCDGGGNIVWAGSPGVGEMQFMVGDFNHNALGEYHPRVEGWNTGLDFSVQWDGDAQIFPVPGSTVGYMSGLDPTSMTVEIWDIYLEAGTQYEFFFYEWGQKDPRLALFRNPGAGQFWASRGAGEWEMSASGYQYYTAPQSDWYGLVVFSNERKTHSSLYQIQIQPLNDCEPLVSGVCQTRAGWPRDFSFTQSAPYWAVVGVAASEGDSKGVHAFTQCDAKGTNLAYCPSSNMAFVVADFNHTATGTYYATVSNNSNDAPWTIVCGTEANQFPLDTVVEGTIGGVEGECGLARIWDVYLAAGTTYQIGFTRGGPADERLALFRNPGNGAYWAVSGGGEAEYWQSGNYTYTAPASDWYGLVAFAGKRGVTGRYSIRISSTSPATGIDTEPEIPERFALYQNAPNPFNPTTTIRYDIPAAGGHVRLDIYDVNGRLIRALVDADEGPGAKSVTWDGKDQRGAPVATGVYFYRLVTPGFSETRKMALMR